MSSLGKCLLIGLLACGSAAADAGDRVKHELVIRLQQQNHHLRVTDTISLPDSLKGPSIDFLLSAALELTESHPPAEAIPVGEVEGFYGINGSSVELGDQVELRRYRVPLSQGETSLSLSYEGAVDFGLSDPKEEYTRGFRETAGIIGVEGVYLAGSGFWYPYFNDQLLEFEMEVDQPEGWHVISQGDGISSDPQGRARWSSSGPMDEIYLVGGPLRRYSETAGSVEALVYLRDEDNALAAKYLSTTAQYLEMYRNLIGRYPYGKFALVENFWETGYGMPSFTLLGPTVIRFPFILHSSYPHEILHNWWGNSVFVDYDTGNWCEGLTAYLADHLIKEQRGQGAEYRRSTLQKYRDYVKESRDFPLTEFRSRHSAATEAVGYGKTMMGFHMLRRDIGDDAFRSSLVRFYRSHKGRRASFADLQASFEQVTDSDLSWFFDQWVGRTGAVDLQLRITEVRGENEAYVVEGSLDQVQGGDPFVVQVPVVVQTTSGVEASVLRLDRAQNPFAIRTEARPLVLQVDPEFDVFRLLDPRETPPSIGQIFGEPEILALLPAQADEQSLEGYRALMDGWQSASHSIEILLDSEIETLPDDRSVWLLGGHNRFADQLFGSRPDLGLEIDADGLTVDQERLDFAGHSRVLIRRHPDNLEKAVGWLAVDPPAAFAGMGRKLPHYGKYSYLGFEGEEPTNTLKGQWPSADSPLRVDLRPEDERRESVEALQLEPRSALAELPPVFSQQALMQHVSVLASEELEGRGLGSEGLHKAALYVKEQFQKAGLLPGGADGSYFQELTVEGENGVPEKTVNVIGYLPGTRGEWKDQSVLLTAHYDHLGRGWPDVRHGNEGKIHPGADDNGSGMAVLMELARNLASAEKPQRNLVFVAFTAEEAGRAGSLYFVEHATPFPAEGIMGVINLDTVGRLHDQKLSVLGTGTATEWQHIFRGCSYVTGVESRNVAEAAGGSDQMSFIEQGIPGVQLFTQAHEDYHRPSDTWDKIDAAGLVKVATFTKEAVSYLVAREEPLTVTIETPAGTRSGAPATPGRPAGQRRVQFGTVPDFAFQGAGVRFDSIVPGSPAEQAGLQAGDVLIRIDDREIANLQGYSDVLKTLEPGQTVSAVVLRAGEELTVAVTVIAR